MSNNNLEKLSSKLVNSGFLNQSFKLSEKYQISNIDEQYFIVSLENDGLVLQIGPEQYNFISKLSTLNVNEKQSVLFIYYLCLKDVLECEHLPQCTDSSQLDALINTFEENNTQEVYALGPGICLSTNPILNPSSGQSCGSGSDCPPGEYCSLVST